MGTQAGYSGDNGPATSAKLEYAEGVAADAAGDIFIADTNNEVVREVNASTRIITTVAGTVAPAIAAMAVRRQTHDCPVPRTSR